MAGPLLAAGVQLAGGIIGGFQKNKAAKKLKKSIDTTMLRARDEIVMDQERALRLRAEDQAEASALIRQDEQRMRDAMRTGYDLKKLRDQAIAAGFNPLTVLANTGGAGYEKQDLPVLTTPFFGRPFMAYSDVTREHASLQAGVGQTLVDTAGYFGDAIAAAGSAFFNQKNNEESLALEKRRLDGMEAETMLRYAAARRMGGSGETVSPFPGGGAAAVMDPRPDFRFGQLTYGGFPWNTDPGTSDSEAIETRYGDLVQAIYGLGVLVSDFWHSGYLQERAYNKPQADAAKTAWGTFESGWNNLRDTVRGGVIGTWESLPSIPKGGLSSSKAPLRITIPSALTGGPGWSDAR